MRAVTGACVVAVAVAVASGSARASVSVQVTWDALLQESTAAVVASPVETRSVWEDGRIYTYTRVRVDQSIEGELPVGGEAWVRTMGGVVGKIGQSVEGEAVLTPGHSGLLFLHPGPPGAFVVTARGQGQFPLVPDAAPGAPPHLVRSQTAGVLLPPKAASSAPFAVDLVHGRQVDDVARDIVAGWDRTHPLRSPRSP